MTAINSISNTQQFKLERSATANTTARDSILSSAAQPSLHSVHQATHQLNHQSLHQSKDGNFQVGALAMEVVEPRVNNSQETRRYGLNLGKIAVSATAIEGQMRQAAGPIAINAKTKVVSLKVQASTEISKTTDNSELKSSISFGAEALAIETTAGIELTISTNTINGLWHSFYRDFVSPAVDLLAGYEAPHLPSPFDTTDVKVVVGGKISGGWGSALNVGATLSTGNQVNSMQAHAKVTPLVIGPTIGTELAISVKHIE